MPEVQRFWTSWATWKSAEEVKQIRKELGLEPAEFDDWNGGRVCAPPQSS